MQSTYPQVQTSEKGKGKEVDPASAPQSGAPTSRKFAGWKEKILSSIGKTLSDDGGYDQGGHESLSRGETNLVSPSFSFRSY